MNGTICGRCDHKSHMTEVAQAVVVYPAVYPGDTQMEDQAFTCDNCHRISIRTRRLRATEEDGWDHGESQIIVSEEWTPRSREEREFPDVPPHIAKAATEATVCLSVGAYRAVGSLARAVIEATAKDRAAIGSNLEKRIDALHAADEIRSHTKEQAHEIRHFGNDMAHGDFVDPVNREEAEEVIELMAEVLDEVYQSPARLARRKEARRSQERAIKHLTGRRLRVTLCTNASSANNRMHQRVASTRGEMTHLLERADHGMSRSLPWSVSSIDPWSARSRLSI